jgi:hypothetical protein
VKIGESLRLEVLTDMGVLTVVTPDVVAVFVDFIVAVVVVRPLAVDERLVFVLDR